MVEEDSLKSKPKKYSVKCQYCQSKGIFTEGPAHGLKHPSWVCANYPTCDATVGCHRGTQAPLGILAKPALRKARQSIHLRIDVQWRRHKSKIDRKQVYEIIAWCMGRKRFHVGATTEQDIEDFENAWPVINKAIAAVSFGFGQQMIRLPTDAQHSKLRQATLATQKYARELN